MSRWSTQQEALPNHDGVKLRVSDQDQPLTFHQIIALWCDEPGFCRFFNDTLASLSYSAFRWETPCLSNNDRPFECVVINSPGLARAADPQAFAEHFATAGEAKAITFDNLRGDATLIVPCPLAAHSAYPHLAAFVRDAPQAQQQELWRQTGIAMQHRKGNTSVWLGTAGAGVAWLHVRLDSRPKYYSYSPYTATA
ncbi:MAG: hypothetical protein AAGA25_04915 [Planctomycetota bacterium]